LKLETCEKILDVGNLSLKSCFIRIVKGKIGGGLEIIGGSSELGKLGSGVSVVSILVTVVSSRSDQ